MTTDEDEKALLLAWEDAEARYAAESARYISIGDLKPGEPIKMPEKQFNAKAIEQLEALEKEVHDARRAYYDAVKATYGRQA